MRTKIITLPSGKKLMFVHRDDMKKAKRNRATMPPVVPVTALPVDCSGDAKVSAPMDANDTLGICGLAMADHEDGIRSFGRGQPGFVEVNADIDKLKAQYLTLSGGDNGTDEDMLVGNAGGPDGAVGPGIWLTGIAGDPGAVVVDHIDVDPADVALVRFCHDQFYGVCQAWSVPDAFIQTWTSGSSFLSPMTPDDENGHFTPLADVDASGNYRLWTWGGWCWVSQAFCMSVKPEIFTTLSPLQFLRSTGYDSHGRHVSDVGAAWVSIGGDPSIVAKMVASFPAKVPSVPPSPSTQPAPGVVDLGPAGSGPLS